MMYTNNDKINAKKVINSCIQYNRMNRQRLQKLNVARSWYAVFSSYASNLYSMKIKKRLKSSAGTSYCLVADKETDVVWFDFEMSDLIELDRQL